MNIIHNIHSVEKYIFENISIWLWCYINVLIDFDNEKINNFVLHLSLFVMNNIRKFYEINACTLQFVQI